VHHLVGSVLHLHLPSVWGGWRGADEEELAGVGQREVDILRGCDGGGLAEVDAAAVVEDALAVEVLADLDGRFFVEEGDDDAF